MFNNGFMSLWTEVIFYCFYLFVMNKFLFFLFSLILFFSCDPVDSSDGNENTGHDQVSGDRITRIDVWSAYEGEDYFERIFCFSYGPSSVSSFGIYTPSNDDPLYRIEESCVYSMDYTASSLKLSVDYKMLYYDGINTDHAIGVETDGDEAECFHVSSGNVQSVDEYDGPFLYFSQLKYEYDDSGYIVSKNDFYDDYNSSVFEWKDGNLVRYVKGKSDSMTVDFTYSDKTAPSELGNFLTDYFINLFDGITSPYVFYTGKSSVNLPSSISFTSSDSEYNASIEFDYHYSGNRLSSVNAVFSDGYDSFDYKLIFYYDDQNPDYFEWIPVIE